MVSDVWETNIELCSPTWMFLPESQDTYFCVTFFVERDNSAAELDAEQTAYSELLRLRKSPWRSRRAQLGGYVLASDATRIHIVR